jgi:multidrug efflux pump subunit AcrA (membrane-fusion protein)
MKRAVFLLLLLISFSCQKTEKSMKVETFPVTVTRPLKRDLSVKEMVFCTLKGWTEADVYPKVQGKVIKIKVSEWKRVSKGDVIAVVDQDITGVEYRPFNVEAPISGIIGTIYVEEGEQVSPPTMSRSMGTPIAKIVSIEKIRAVCETPERILPSIKIGTKALLRISSSEKTFEGRVWRMNAVVNPSTRSAQIEALFDNPSYILRPGMYGELTLIIEERKGVLSIPSDIIMKNEKMEEYVWVADNGIAKRRFIERGITDGLYTEIKKGLTEEDEVIVMGKDVLREGAKLNIRMEEKL